MQDTYELICIVTIVAIYVIFCFRYHIALFLMNFFDIFTWKNPKSIKVFMPCDSQYSELMKKCFEKWEEVTQYNVLFNFTDDKDDADINVVFKSKFDSSDVEWYDFYIGQTVAECSNNPKMTITIVEKDNAVVRKLEQEEIIQTMLHEIGHSIGLWRHSFDKNSIMYSTVNSEIKQEILEKDVERLKKMYKF